MGIRSVAVPALGCGNGGLRWHDVLQGIRTAFELAPEVRWLVFEPVARVALKGDPI